ncbi:hypothetical protein B0H15DRAFT_956904 [Mycena belliarum]|uniref:Uncharacterized protein n=1 Tax=Mycena belliarum TaxID=1033014 RepID=A0AAD6TTD4_9AGAR|nr:hypothetical protein B0H15DRAFT_956904 [Mycena belliae]
MSDDAACYCNAASSVSAYAVPLCELTLSSQLLLLELPSARMQSPWPSECKPTLQPLKLCYINALCPRVVHAAEASQRRARRHLLFELPFARIAPRPAFIPRSSTCPLYYPKTTRAAYRWHRCALERVLLRVAMRCALTLGSQPLLLDFPSARLQPKSRGNRSDNPGVVWRRRRSFAVASTTWVATTLMLPTTSCLHPRLARVPFSATSSRHSQNRVAEANAHASFEACSSHGTRSDDPEALHRRHQLRGNDIIALPISPSSRAARISTGAPVNTVVRISPSKGPTARRDRRTSAHSRQDQNAGLIPNVLPAPLSLAPRFVSPSMSSSLPCSLSLRIFGDARRYRASQPLASIARQRFSSDACHSDRLRNRLRDKLSATTTTSSQLKTGRRAHDDDHISCCGGCIVLVPTLPPHLEYPAPSSIHKGLPSIARDLRKAAPKTRTPPPSVETLASSPPSVLTWQRLSRSNDVGTDGRLGAQGLRRFAIVELAAFDFAPSTPTPAAACATNSATNPATTTWSSLLAARDSVLHAFDRTHPIMPAITCDVPTLALPEHPLFCPSTAHWGATPARPHARLWTGLWTGGLRFRRHAQVSVLDPWSERSSALIHANDTMRVDVELAALAARASVRAQAESAVHRSFEACSSRGTRSDDPRSFVGAISTWQRHNLFHSDNVELAVREREAPCSHPRFHVPRLCNAAPSSLVRAPGLRDECSERTTKDPRTAFSHAVNDVAARSPTPSACVLREPCLRCPATSARSPALYEADLALETSFRSHGTSRAAHAVLLRERRARCVHSSSFRFHSCSRVRQRVTCVARDQRPSHPDAASPHLPSTRANVELMAACCLSLLLHALRLVLVHRLAVFGLSSSPTILRPARLHSSKMLCCGLRAFPDFDARVTTSAVLCAPVSAASHRGRATALCPTLVALVAFQDPLAVYHLAQIESSLTETPRGWCRLRSLARFLAFVDPSFRPLASFLKGLFSSDVTS